MGRGLFGAARFGFVFLISILTGCAGVGPSEELPPEYTLPDKPAPMYIIGPLDNVNIFVWRNPELSQTVPVRPDGRITTPLIEDVRASGRTPSELARVMESELSKYLKNPIVTVIVTGFVGRPTEQIRVVGEAAEPQSIPYRENISVLDVMIDVGGITEFAAGNRAVLLRFQEGGYKEYRLRLEDLLNDGDLSANGRLAPGDVVVIPEAFF